MKVDPNSVDYMFGKIMTILEAQDQSSAAWRIQTTATVNGILEEAKKTNGRVTGLERLRDVTKGKLAVITLIAGFASGGVGSLLTVLAEKWAAHKP